MKLTNMICFVPAFHVNRSVNQEVNWALWTKPEAHYSVRFARLSKPTKICTASENVANLRSHDNGVTIQTIRSSLQELNYCIKDKILSPHEFGVLHHRLGCSLLLFIEIRCQIIKKIQVPRCSLPATENSC